MRRLIIKFLLILGKKKQFTGERGKEESIEGGFAIFIKGIGHFIDENNFYLSKKRKEIP